MAALKENTTKNDYSILVTGATGFIGKKLVERLSKTGYKITAMTIRFLCFVQKGEHLLHICRY